MKIIARIEQRLKNIESLLLAQKKVITFDEAATLTGLSKSYLYKLTHSGGVPCYKPNGKQIYFDRYELEEWLLRNRKSTTEELESKAATYLATKKIKQL